MKVFGCLPKAISLTAIDLTAGRDVRCVDHEDNALEILRLDNAVKSVVTQFAMPGGVGEKESFVYSVGGIIDRSVLGGRGVGGNGEGYFYRKGGLGCSSFCCLAALKLCVS